MNRFISVFFTAALMGFALALRSSQQRTVIVRTPTEKDAIAQPNIVGYSFSKN